MITYFIWLLVDFDRAGGESLKFSLTFSIFHTVALVFLERGRAEGGTASARGGSQNIFGMGQATKSFRREGC